ncbi:MAG: hypothetical protein V4643_06720 [Bacteroidota bacterium]
MKKSYHIFYFLFFSLLLSLQALSQPFSKQEYVHGKLTKLRSCFDVNVYDITVKVDIDQQFISGTNAITFTE